MANCFGSSMASQQAPKSKCKIKGSFTTDGYEPVLCIKGPLLDNSPSVFFNEHLNEHLEEQWIWIL